jgi:hypothetical protein
MIGIGCCASATSGEAAAAPLSSVMNARRFMPDMGVSPPCGGECCAPLAYHGRSAGSLGRPELF